MNKRRNSISATSLKSAKSSLRQQTGAFAPGGVTGRNALFIVELV
jgi:hypothetical protein